MPRKRRRQTSVKIPNDRSILSFVGLNAMNDGETFADDGWVYRKKKRLRKWFGHIGDNHRIWEPKLQRPGLLEKAYRRVLKYYDKQLRRWREAYKLFAIGSEFYGYAHGQAKWIKFDCKQDSLQYGYHDKQPCCKLRQDLVDLYFAVNRRITRAATFQNLFWDALDRSFRNAIMARLRDKPIDREATFRMSVNGRSYWYSSGRNGTKCFARAEETEVIKLSV